MIKTEIIDVDNAPYSKKHGMYGGMSGLKDGLVINGEDYLVKYPKNASYLSRHEEMSYTTDPLSEYLASHIYEMLGFPTHETMLVTRRNKIAVACKDFISDGEMLLEFRTIKNAANRELSEKLEEEFTSTDSSHVVDFDEVLLHLKYNDLLNTIPNVRERFFSMIVMDAFLNNGDRNNGNWGIIRKTGAPDRLAPVYDNGGAFNGKTPDSRLSKMLDNYKESNFTNGISVYGKDGNNYLVRDILSFDILELNDTILYLVPRIKQKLPEMYELIDSIPKEACSDVRKEFYKKSLQIRCEKLLLPAYEKIIGNSSLDEFVGIDENPPDSDDFVGLD